MAILLICSESFFSMVGLNPGVSRTAAKFIQAALPHILFAQMFDIHKHQKNSFRLAYMHMVAQAAGTLVHVPLLYLLLSLVPSDPILAIGVATSVSSLIKFLMIFSLGMLKSEVRDAFFISFSAYWWSRNDEA